MNIQELLRDESKAPGDYMSFIRSTKLSSTQKKQINSIIRDERKHHKILLRIRKQLTK